MRGWRWIALLEGDSDSWGEGAKYDIDEVVAEHPTCD